MAHIVWTSNSREQETVCSHGCPMISDVLDLRVVSNRCSPRSPIRVFPTLLWGLYVQVSDG